MKFKYNDKVEIIKGFYKGQRGVVLGRFLWIWIYVVRDVQFCMCDAFLIWNLKKINDEK